MYQVPLGIFIGSLATVTVGFASMFHWRFVVIFTSFYAMVGGSDFLSLRVMTLNTWLSGSQVLDGLHKIRDAILTADADVVGLQEVFVGFTFQLLKLLGPEWSGVERTNLIFPDSAIISRHLIDIDSVNQTDWAIGCSISFRNDPGQQFRLWNVHLAPLTDNGYGPYFACSKSVWRQ